LARHHHNAGIVTPEPLTADAWLWRKAPGGKIRQSPSAEQSIRSSGFSLLAARSGLRLSTPRGSIHSGAKIPGKAFWSLMDAWHVPDAQAPDLIGYPGKLGRDGKRPRSRQQAKLLAYLLEIDQALRAVDQDPGVWLHLEQRGARSRVGCRWS
jgi:hypothetical protein